MFWRFSYSASQLQTLLEKEDITLQEIIEEDDVLQECKSNNEKLIEFLSQEKNLKQLVTYVISTPSDEINENIKFKYATISCELLTCDIPTINDAVIKNYELVDKMYSFLHNETPLNPLLASYFAKVIGSLISRKTEPFLNYIQSKTDFVDLFLKHINTSAIMDILLRLLTTIDNQEMKSRVLEWLNSINIIEKLVELFHYDYSNLVQSNASQVLCDIIRISREQLLSTNENNLQLNSLAINKQNDADENNAEANLNKIEETNNFLTNPLLDSIESPDRINRLLELIFQSVGKPNCSIIYGIDVLLTIMDFKYLTTYDNYETQNDEANKAKRKREFDLIALKGIKTVIGCCTDKLETINSHLIDFEPKIKSLTLTNGKEFKLLGKDRLYIIKLLAKIFCFNSIEFTQAIIKIELVNRLIDFMIEYKSNNFLHTQVTSIFRNIFSQENMFCNEINQSDVNVKQLLIQHVLNDCQFLSKLIYTWKKYFEEKESMSEEKKKETDYGYLGHLIIISNLIWENYKDENARKNFEDIFLKEDQLLVIWKELYDNKLMLINDRNVKDLVRNPFHVSNSDVDKDIMENNDLSNRKFLDIQREMKINCLDNFSLSEDHIIPFQPKFPDLFNKTQGISFQVDSNDDNANMFEQVCSQRDNMCLSTEQSNLIMDEEIWITKEIKFSDNENTNLDLCKKKEHLMDISEDDDNSLSNKQNNKLVDNSLNEILLANTVLESEKSVTKREIDEDSNSDDSIDDNTNENEDKIKQETFALEEDISDEKQPQNEEMKNEFKDFSKSDEKDQLKLFATDPWSSNFEGEIENREKNEKIMEDNWANFENS